MCRVTVTRHHTRRRRQHRISTIELEVRTEAKLVCTLGIHDIRHYAHSRALRHLGHVFRKDADRTPGPSFLRRCWVVDGKQPTGTSILKPRTFTIPLYYTEAAWRAGTQTPPTLS
jgi:hypothetical protein